METVLLFSFLILMPFIYFSWQIYLARTSNNVLDKSGGSGHLISDLTEVKVLPFRYWVYCSLWTCHMWPLLCWRTFHLCLLYWEVFNHPWMLNFVTCFSCIYWDDYIVFVLQFVNVVYHIDLSENIEASFHPWGKSFFTVVYETVDFKKSQPKSWEFYLVGNFRNSVPGDSISSNPERTALRRQGKKSGYI